MRAFEHRGFSGKTNRPLAITNFSAIRIHGHEHDHRIWDSGFKVTFRAGRMSDVRVAETSCIFKDKPELNINESGVKLYTIK